MKGYATVNSPYARKVRIAIIETGQPDLIDWQMLSRAERTQLIPPINPLGKVPVLVLDSGEALFDSPVICAYVDSLHNGQKLIPSDEQERWRVLRLEAQGDGLGEAIVAVALEKAKPEDSRSQALIDRQGGKAASAMAALNGEAANFRDPVSMGEIAVACAIGYLELRNVDDGWRDRYPTLATWYSKICERPSFIETAPVADG
jgi:glutathione S-transferase